MSTSECWSKRSTSASAGGATLSRAMRLAMRLRLAASVSGPEALAGVPSARVRSTRARATGGAVRGSFSRRTTSGSRLSAPARITAKAAVMRASGSPRSKMKESVLCIPRASMESASSTNRASRSRAGDSLGLKKGSSALPSSSPSSVQTSTPTCAAAATSGSGSLESCSSVVSAERSGLAQARSARTHARRTTGSGS